MHPFSPPVRAVLLTTETLNLKVQEKLIDLNKKEHLQPEFLKVSKLQNSIFYCLINLYDTA